MRRRRLGFLLAGLVVAVAACGSSAKTASPPKITSTTPTTSTTTAKVAATGEVLSFREVLGQYPYDTPVATGPGVFPGCEKAATPAAKQTPDMQVVLADRSKEFCYILGPVLLTGASIDKADATFDDSMSSWVITVHFGNDDFLDKVATPMINKSVAIVLDGVVQSAPNINPGITGRDVEISGGFDKAAAREIAKRIDPSSASREPVTPTTTELDVFAKRCEAVGPAGGLTGTSEMTVGTALAGFRRAHEPVPSVLANLDAATVLAVCGLADLSAPGHTPTTICPNGDTAEIAPGSADLDEFAVDANLTKIKLPAAKYLFPDLASMPQPDVCTGLGAP